MPRKNMMKPFSKLSAFTKQWPHAWTTFKFGCLFTGAELSQQIVIRKIWDDDSQDWRWSKNGWKTRELDWGSIGRYAIWGFAFFPHVLTRWYRILDSKIVTQSPWATATLKTVVDQTFFPLPILGSFYLFLSALEGKVNSLGEWTEECEVKLWSTLKARYCFMIPAQVGLKTGMF